MYDQEYIEAGLGKLEMPRDQSIPGVLYPSSVLPPPPPFGLFTPYEKQVLEGMTPLSACPICQKPLHVP